MTSATQWMAQKTREDAEKGRTEFYVYVLELDNGYYVGHTFNVGQRFKGHLDGDTAATAGHDIKLVWVSYPFSTRAEANELESSLKRMIRQRDRRFLEITGLKGPDGGRAMVTAEAPFRIRTIKRRSKQKDEVKHGPAQIPPDPDNGHIFTEDDIRSFSRDTLGRDAFSLDTRVREWVETEELYEQHKDAPLPIDHKELHLPKYGIHLVGGDMGQGKTLWAAHVARHFRRRGWNVTSTAGLLIGQRLDTIKAYSFPEYVHPWRLHIPR